MIAAAKVLTIVALGLGLYLIGHRHGRRDANEAYRRDLTENWRQGYTYGWTTGRTEMVGEERAKAHHPSNSPVSHAARIFEDEAGRIEREQG